MQRIILPVVALLLLIAGAIFLFWQDPGSGSPDVTEPSTAVGAILPEAGVLSEAAPSAPPPTTTIDRVEAVTPPIEPEMQRGAPVAEGEGLLVRVLNAETRKPIVGAEVLVADIGEEDMPRVQQLLVETRDIEAVLEALSVVYQTGSDGTVRVPTVRGEGAIAARKGDLFGVARDRARGRQEIEILCLAGMSVSALVVDDRNTPMENAPVALRIHRGGSTHAPLALRTDAQGLARFRRIELFLQDDGVDGASVAIDGPIGAIIEQPFDLTSPPTEPIRLVMPLHGGVEIELRTDGGEAWTEPALVSVSEYVKRRLSFGFEFTSGGALPVTNGMAHYPMVGLGLQLEVSAARMDGTRIGSIVAPGPLRAGEIARIVLTESIEYAYLVGRLVDEQRQPVANAQIFSELERESDGGRSSSGSGFRTDTDGGFRIEVREPELPDGTTRVLRMRERSELGVSGRSAEIALDYALPPGNTDLGELVLARPLLLAAGRVVNELGAAVAECAVQVQAMQKYGDGPDEFFWNHLDHGHTETGAEGEFAIYCATDAVQIRVQAYAQDSWCEGTVVTPGAAGLSVIVREAAKLAGKLLVDADTKPEGLRLSLKPVEPTQEHGWHAFDVRADGAFTFSGMRPGRYDVELTMQNSNEALMRVEAVNLMPGENHDPRLDPLDARGRTGSITVRATGPDGAELSQFRVWRLHDGERATRLSTRNGEVMVPLADGPVDLVIEADGCMRESLSRVSEDQLVQLRAGMPVRLTVANASLVPAEFFVSVGMRPVADRDRGLNSFAPIRVDASGSVQWNVVEYGTHEAFVSIYTTGEFVRSTSVQHDLSRFEIGTGGGQFSLNLNQESLDRALQSLREP